MKPRKTDVHWRYKSLVVGIIGLWGYRTRDGDVLGSMLSA